MKKMFVTLLMCLAILLSSCNVSTNNTHNETEVLNQQIKELKSMINDLDAEKSALRSDFEKLKFEFQILKNQKNEINVSTNNNNPKLSKFLYEIRENKAIITGYSGDEKNLVIPSCIDGYKVYGIGESAFAYSDIESVIVCEGVEKIDWFAFYAIPTLKSVTIPPSVNSIGYSAFEHVSVSFSICCQENTYACNYAKNAGITYIII